MYWYQSMKVGDNETITGHRAFLEALDLVQTIRDAAERVADEPDSVQAGMALKEITINVRRFKVLVEKSQLDEREYERCDNIVYPFRRFLWRVDDNRESVDYELGRELERALVAVERLCDDYETIVRYSADSDDDP